MKLTFEIDSESLADLLCVVLQGIEDNNPTVEAKCFYSEVCTLTTDDTVRVNAARVQSILEHHANPLESKEFTDAVLAIGDALALTTTAADIEHIFCNYIGLTVDEFLGEYGRTLAPEPLFLQSIINLTQDQTALTAAANIQYAIDTEDEDYNIRDHATALEGLAVIITNCGLGKLRQLEHIFLEHLDIDVLAFIYDYPQLFETEQPNWYVVVELWNTTDLPVAYGGYSTEQEAKEHCTAANYTTKQIDDLEAYIKTHGDWRGK